MLIPPILPVLLLSVGAGLGLSPSHRAKWRMALQKQAAIKRRSTFPQSCSMCLMSVWRLFLPKFICIPNSRSWPVYWRCLSPASWLFPPWPVLSSAAPPMSRPFSSSWRDRGFQYTAEESTPVKGEERREKAVCVMMMRWFLLLTQTTRFDAYKHFPPPNPRSMSSRTQREGQGAISSLQKPIFCAANTARIWQVLYQPWGGIRPNSKTAFYSFSQLPCSHYPPFFRFKINFHLLPTWCLKALRWKKKRRRKNIFHLGWGYTQRAYQKWPCTPSDSFAEGFWASMLFLLILKEKDKEVVILGRDSKAKGVVHRGWKSQVIFQQWKSFSAPVLLEKGWIHMSVFHFTDYEWLLCSQHYEPEWGLCEKAPLPCAHGYSTHIGQPIARTTKSPSLS